MKRPKIHIPDPVARKRIVEIACALVAGRVANGEIPDGDDEALQAATYQALLDARTAYYAALEYVSG